MVKCLNKMPIIRNWECLILGFFGKINYLSVCFLSSLPNAFLEEREVFGFMPARSLISFSLVTMLFVIWGIPNNMNDVLIKLL